MTTSDLTLELRMITVGDWQENCYLLVDQSTKDAILVDPGAEAERLLDWLAGVTVRSILLTHAHVDHVGALTSVRTALNVRVGLHPAEIALATQYHVAPNFELNEGDVIHLGAHTIQVAYTPGHTPGGVCLLFDARALVGDTIFPGGPGHTHTPDEFKQILASLQRTVFTWPDATTLYPGHGRSTTVGRERPRFEAFIARTHPAELCGDVTW